MRDRVAQKATPRMDRLATEGPLAFSAGPLEQRFRLLVGRAGALGLGGGLGGAGIGLALAFLLRAGAVVLVVGAVEAAALEVHAHRVEHLAQGAAAFGADLQRSLRHALEDLELVAA